MTNFSCRPLRLAVFACLLLWNASLFAEEAELVFDGAWVRAMPPGMKMTAGFGTLRNAGSEPIEIRVFSSAEFGKVSLHRTEIVDGMSRMREVPSVQLAPGASVDLEPGGYHLMLMMPNGPLEPGQAVSVEMTASDGRVFRFSVPVERR